MINGVGGFVIRDAKSAEVLARYGSSSAAAAALRTLIRDGSDVGDLESVAIAEDGSELLEVSGKELLDAVAVQRLIDSADR